MVLNRRNLGRRTQGLRLGLRPGLCRGWLLIYGWAQLWRSDRQPHLGDASRCRVVGRLARRGCAAVQPFKSLQRGQHARFAT